MTENYYISITTEESKTKTIFIIHQNEKGKDCFFLTEMGLPSWQKCKDISKETNIHPISKNIFYKLKKLNDFKRYKIYKYVYYRDLFKDWGVYEELCEVLI